MPGPIRPTNTTNRVSLDVANSRVESLKDFAGLAMEAEIALSDPGPDRMPRKQVSSFKWTTGRATVGMGMGTGLYHWIQRAFDGTGAPTNGSLVLADFNYKAQSRLDFEDAILTSITVPKLDGSSKDAAYFGVEFEPGRVRYSKAGGEDIRGLAGTKQKAWLCSNFRVEIGSLPCDRVASVDSFTWKSVVSTDLTGLSQTPSRSPAQVTVPDLSLAISMADQAPWAEAARKWFIDGERTDASEMSGRIVFLGPNLKDELGEISLRNIGFKRFSLVSPGATGEEISRFNCGLYVERMAFKINAYSL